MIPTIDSKDNNYADDILFNLNPTVSFELLIRDRGNQEHIFQLLKEMKNKKTTIPFCLSSIPFLAAPKYFSSFKSQ